MQPQGLNLLKMLGTESRRSVAWARRKLSKEAWTSGWRMAESPTEDDAVVLSSLS